MATLFSLDDASSSRMMSMSDRQSQLVLQRRQIIRQQSQSQVNSNPLKNVETSNFGSSVSSPAHHPVATNNTADDSIAAHSPSKLSESCTSTAVNKHKVKKQTTSDEPKCSDSCDENSNHDAEKENQEAINLLERELERKKEELEQTRAKLKAKEKVEVDQLRKENKSRQREPSSDASKDGARENASVLSSTYSAGGSSIGGSDKGYQRYLDAYHHQPKNLLLTNQLSSETTGKTTAASDVSDFSGSRRLSSTSSSRPVSRAARRSQESSSSSYSSFAMTKMTPSTIVPIKLSSSNTAETQMPDKEAGNQEQEQRSTLFDSPRRDPSVGRSLPSLQQELSSIGKANLDDPVVMRSILMNPCSKDSGMVQCCIRRNKGSKATLGLGLYPEYRCYLRENNNSRTETFLMTAKKRAANKTSNYLISMGRNDHDKDSKNILGKLRGSFNDTEYILYDDGKNPEEYSQDGKNNRTELGAILYAPSSSLGSKGPRTISVGINNLDEDFNPVKVWQPRHRHDDTMLDYLKKIDTDDVSGKDKKLLLHLQSKPPAWDEALERFFLNFNGRVTMASVKNFQLVDDQGEMCLQFGRTGKDEFILDVKWPLSPFQAFALALSSFDSKVGCD